MRNLACVFISMAGVAQEEKNTYIDHSYNWLIHTEDGVTPN